MAAKQDRLRAKYKKLGLCSCGGPRDRNTLTCSRCLEKQRVRGQHLRSQDAWKDTREKRVQNGFCPRCGGPPGEGEGLTCRSCLDVIRDAGVQIKREVLNRYGGKCACCGEARLPFLCIDHVNGDGAEHRRLLSLNNHRSVSGRRIYQWLRANRYPTGFRVLCFNCNQGRWINGGICPHEEERAAQEALASDCNPEEEGSLPSPFSE